MTTTTKTTSKENVHSSLANYRLPFGDISQPGSYVSNECGDLFRIPEDALIAGRSPQMEIVSREPRMVTKLTDDPWIPISKARQLAADADLYINF